MQRETLERRLELLNMEGNGKSPPEIVKELSKLFQCTERTVQYDLAKRGIWQPRIQQLKTALLRIINRYEQIYRKASFQYLKAKNDVKASLLALRIMRDINRDCFDFLRQAGYTIQKPETIERILKWVDPEECKQQYPSNINHTQDKQNSTSTTRDSEYSHVDADGEKPKLVRTKPSAK